MKNIFVWILISLSLVESWAAKPLKVRQAGTLRISLHHGYLDNRPKSTYVGGKLTQEWMAYLLSDSCQNNPLQYFCDFQLDQSAPNFLRMTKQITTANGRLNIIIEDYSPNITENDDLNSTTYRTQQLQLSTTSKAAFHQAISQADIVMYLGHSRFGGGPDFGLPVLTREKDHDIRYYQTKYTGFKELKQVFNQTQAPPSHVALLSCSSGPHFGDQMKSSFPSVEWILTKDVQTQTAETGAINALKILNGILEQNIRTL